MSYLLRAIKKAQEAQALTGNPYATEHAAQVLEANGQYEDAAAVRAAIDPSEEEVGAGDPLDFWLAVEDLESSQGD